MGDNATKECSRTTPGDAKITEECFLSVRGRSFECFDCDAKRSVSACDAALAFELKFASHGIEGLLGCSWFLHHTSMVQKNTIEP